MQRPLVISCLAAIAILAGLTPLIVLISSAHFDRRNEIRGTARWLLWDGPRWGASLLLSSSNPLMQNPIIQKLTVEFFVIYPYLYYATTLVTGIYLWIGHRYGWYLYLLIALGGLINKTAKQLNVISYRSRKEYIPFELSARLSPFLKLGSIWAFNYVFFRYLFSDRVLQYFSLST